MVRRIAVGAAGAFPRDDAGQLMLTSHPPTRGVAQLGRDDGRRHLPVRHPGNPLHFALLTASPILSRIAARARCLQLSSSWAGSRATWQKSRLFNKQFRMAPAASLLLEFLAANQGEHAPMPRASLRFKLADARIRLGAHGQFIHVQAMPHILRVRSRRLARLTAGARTPYHVSSSSARRPAAASVKELP
ncbi:hypothetical protein VTK26DRAFT_6560 [Humicola hyalothermophila]